MKFIKTFFSIILSIIFVIVLAVGIFVWTTNSFISKKNLKSMFNDIGIENLIKADLENNVEINNNYFKIPEVKDLISNYTNHALDYLFDDKDIPKITENDIEKIVNSNYYKDVLGISLSEEEKAEYSESLKEAYINIDEAIEKEMSTVKKDLFEDETLRVILSNNFILTIIISLIILAILIGICRWSWYRPFSWIGISMIVAGGLNIMLNIIINPMLSTEPNDFVADNIKGHLLTDWLSNGLLIIFFGFILLFCYFILNRKFNELEEDKLLDNL